MSTILPNQIHPVDCPINESIPIQSSNSNAVDNVNIDLKSIPAVPTDSRRRSWSRVLIIIIPLILLLIIIAGIVGAVIYLTRSTNNTDVLLVITASTTSDYFCNQSTQKTTRTTTVDSNHIQFSQTTASASSVFTDTFSTLAATSQSHVCLYDNPCKNGGTCHPVGTNESICECITYYFGLTCEQMNGTMDSVIISRVFSRNKWVNALAVIDVTGSMHSCANTIVEWITKGSTSTSIKMYVFFNDGDGMEDENKTIGVTGGIYSTNSTNVSEVLRVMDDAKSKGSGGDGPENDIEALLYGINVCPTCQNIVHIADNAVTPRDLVLLPHLKNKYIKVVPCQVSNSINFNLLNIAMKTNGSLHTIDQDLINLAAIVMNDTINIGSHRYRRTVDGFILV